MSYKFNPFTGQFDVVSELATPVSVANGGTGSSSFTAYSVILAGTTGTGALTNVSGVGTSGQVLTSNGAGSAPTWQAASGGASYREYWLDAASLQAIETNSASLELLSGTNVKTFVRAFDDTTEEYGNFKMFIPQHVDTSTAVVIDYYVNAKTAAASKNVGLTFGHSLRADSEDFDAAYTDLDTGATSINATQDSLTMITDSWTISSGVTAKDLAYGRISRDPGVTDDLTGDMYFHGANFKFTLA